MNAMILSKAGRDLEWSTVDLPVPQPNQVLIKIAACGVCRTDLHVVDGELLNSKLPLIPGHEIVGHAVALGSHARAFQLGDRVGVPWLGYTCGHCKYCQAGQENLCLNSKFTGYTLDGGYVEFVCADEKYCFAIPDSYSDVEAAPLLSPG